MTKYLPGPTSEVCFLSHFLSGFKEFLSRTRLNENKMLHSDAWMELDSLGSIVSLQDIILKRSRMIMVTNQVTNTMSFLLSSSSGSGSYSSQSYVASGSYSHGGGDGSYSEVDRAVVVVMRDMNVEWI